MTDRTQQTTGSSTGASTLGSAGASGPGSTSGAGSTTGAGSATGTGSATGGGVVGTGGSALVSTEGRTTIADTVVSKIAGIATREVDGVHALGGGTTRAIGAALQRLPGGRESMSQGVSVEVGERQAAVDVDVVIDYGVAITEVANGIRRNVIASVEQMTGLDVTEVNVTVHDIYLASDDDGQSGQQQQTSRVQ